MRHNRRPRRVPRDPLELYGSFPDFNDVVEVRGVRFRLQGPFYKQQAFEVALPKVEHFFSVRLGYLYAIAVSAMIRTDA